MHNKTLSIVGILSDEVDPLVSVMKVRQRRFPPAQRGAAHAPRPPPPGGKGAY
jgi:hypothetical protein